MLDALILAGGLGTRLAPVVPDLPKALAPIRGTPFLDLLLDRLAESKTVSKAILALGFRSEAILRHYRGKTPPLPIRFVVEGEPLGTGGAVLNALPHTTGDALLILNGDCFCDLSYADFAAYHRAKKADVTLATFFSDDLRRYGSICFGDDGRICGFQEKAAEKKAGYLSAGIYLAQREALSSFETKACSIETDLFPKLLAKKAFAYVHRGSFLDIGTPESYTLAQEGLS